MKKKNNAMPWWGWFTWVVTIVLGIIAYTYLPSEVATKANHMRSSWLIVLYEPVIMLVVLLLWQLLWRIDPKKKNYESFWSTYRYIGGVIIVCIGIIYATVLGHTLNILSIRFAPTAYGIMFMLIANVSPRLQPNWWVGFRTPWTLSSTESWIRTHRLGGQLGIPMGLLIIIFAWILPTNGMMVIAVVVPVLLWVGIVVVASYFYAKKDLTNR